MEKWLYEEDVLTDDFLDNSTFEDIKGYILPVNWHWDELCICILHGSTYQVRHGHVDKGEFSMEKLYRLIPQTERYFSDQEKYDLKESPLLGWRCRHDRDYVVYLPAQVMTLFELNFNLLLHSQLNHIYDYRYYAKIIMKGSLAAIEKKEKCSRIFQCPEDSDYTERCLSGLSLPMGVFFSDPEHFNGYLSNQYPCKFRALERTFQSLQQFLTYYKAAYFQDKALAEQILQIRNAGRLSRLGESVAQFDLQKWIREVPNALYRGLREKFGQNQNLRDLLINTGNALIIYCKSKDPVWSCGLDLTDNDRLNSRYWTGKNLMGEFLMVVRQELAQEG